MRHPALTRFFAAFLAVMSAITMFSGAVCIRKAAENREKQNTTIERLAGKNAEARQLRAELDAMPEEFEVQSAEYDESKERYESEKNSYRKDLSIYTATESALQQAQEQIDEGYAALRMGWIQHDNGEKKLDEAEAQFRPGYEQYLAGKAQLEAGRKQVSELEKLRDSLPEPALMHAGLNTAKAMVSGVSGAVAAMEGTKNNPPRDAETGEIDRDALRSTLLSEYAAIASRIDGARQLASTVYSAEQIDRAMAPTAAALERAKTRLSDGDASAEELLAAASELTSSVRSAIASAEKAISDGEQTVAAIENLPALTAQLDEAEAKLKEAEPALLQAKKGFDEGRKQLDAAKQQLIWAEAQLIAGTKELEENAPSRRSCERISRGARPSWRRSRSGSRPCSW